MKKITRIMILMVVALFVFSGMTYAKSRSGSCGKKVKWKLSSSGTLTIRGKGPMKNYSKYTGTNATPSGDVVLKRPWQKYAPSIKKIVIKKGVTKIGAYAFAGLNNAKKISIPKTVKEIGWNAFEGSGIEKITVPNGAKTVADDAFMSCPKLKKLILPKSLEYCPEPFGYGYNGFTEVYFRGSRADWLKLVGQDDEGPNDGLRMHYNYKGH